MTMTKREKILISFVLVLAVFFVYYMYFLTPCLDELGSLKDDITNKKITNATNAELSVKLKVLEQDITDTQEEIKSYGKGIPSGFDQPSILVYLKETLATAETQKEMFYFNSIIQLGDFEICTVTITMKSSYEELKKVLDLLAKGKYYVRMTGIYAEYSTTLINNDDAKNTKNTESTSNTVANSGMVIDEGMLEISLNLEFYNFLGPISPDTVYPFSGSYYYGGDIFY